MFLIKHRSHLFSAPSSVYYNHTKRIPHPLITVINLPATEFPSRDFLKPALEYAIPSTCVRYRTFKNHVTLSPLAGFLEPHSCDLQNTLRLLRIHTLQSFDRDLLTLINFLGYQ